MMRKAVLTSIVSCAALLLLSHPALATEKGRELINSLGCKACHQFEGSGGSLGPALEGTGARLSQEQIRQKMIEPRATNPSSAMPSYKHLSEADLDEIVKLLQNLK